MTRFDAARSWIVIGVLAGWLGACSAGEVEPPRGDNRPTAREMAVGDIPRPVSADESSDEQSGDDRAARRATRPATRGTAAGASRPAASRPPTSRPATSQPGGFTDADYARHIAELRERLPLEGFAIEVSPPFVVLGDMPRAQVQRKARDTVAWAVKRLKALYFTADPDQILDVWLFDGKESYNRNSQRFFGIVPHTIYGFYNARHRALIMNIATGGGTLVHEIVHPFMEANFPACPAWFNEGLASLYEQSDERDGHIVGLTNWRLAGLKEAIRGGRVPAFETLMATTTGEFYGDDRGTNYAQARYLCYWLQEHDLLVEFYRRFRRDAATDPGGIATLREVLRDADLKVFKTRWEQYVLRLEYRG